jgi:AcrR family transcriptional regulator
MLEARVTNGAPQGHDTAETRQRLLDAAERLFAVNGYEATPVRDITAAAGCNVAAVNYHFGGKEELYLEVFRRLLGELRGRRIRRIRREVEEAGDELTLERFLESFCRSFLEPLVDQGRRRPHLITLMDREMQNHHLPPDVFFRELIRPMSEVTLEGLRQVMPELDETCGLMCLMSVVGQLIHVLKMRTMVSRGEIPVAVPTELGAHVAHIVRFSAAGILACAAGNGGPPDALGDRAPSVDTGAGAGEEGYMVEEPT